MEDGLNYEISYKLLVEGPWEVFDKIPKEGLTNMLGRCAKR